MRATSSNTQTCSRSSSCAEWADRGSEMLEDLSVRLRWWFWAQPGWSSSSSPPTFSKDFLWPDCFWNYTDQHHQFWRSPRWNQKHSCWPSSTFCLLKYDMALQDSCSWFWCCWAHWNSFLGTRAFLHTCLVTYNGPLHNCSWSIWMPFAGRARTWKWAHRVTPAGWLPSPPGFSHLPLYSQLALCWCRCGLPW